MLHTITHGKLSATIFSVGAELKSLIDNTNNEEYVWQGDPNSWQGSAPILFPIVGRLKNGQYQFRGNTYQLAKHGFARTSEFSVESQQNSSITFGLNANEQTRQSYPFEFCLRVTFTLQQAGLVVSYQVQNQGDDVMYFTLGSHPALRLPLENNVLSDYFIAFEQPETMDCYFLENNLLTENPIKEYLNNETTIDIRPNLFENDALIFKGIKSTKIHLKHRRMGNRISMHTGNAPYFGLWSKPNAPFICFEPWYSHDDPSDASGELTEKPGMMTLKPGAVFNTHYQLSLSE